MTEKAAAVLSADEDERRTIGLCLREPECYDLARAVVGPTDFQVPLCRAYFEALQTLANRGEVPLGTSAIDEVRRRARDEVVGKNGELTLALQAHELVNEAVGPASYVTHHARNVLRASMRRRLREVGMVVARLAVESTIDADAAVRLAAEAVQGVGRASRQGPVLLEPAELAAVGARVVAGDQDEVLPFGFHDVDKLCTGGARGGQLILVGGRPGAGKSAFLRDVGRHFARHGRCLFASNEMDEAGIAARDLASDAGVPLTRILDGSTGFAEQDRLRNAVHRMELLPLVTFVDGGMTSAALRTRAVELHGRGGLLAIVVDYVQRMADPGRSPLERVGYTVRSLKALAMELRIPVVAGAQLNRGGERTDHDKPPTLIDLRDSGELEQEADVVFLLHRLSYYYPSEAAWKAGGKLGRYPGHEADLWIAKQRQGQSGVAVKLAWLGAMATFRDFVAREE